MAGILSPFTAATARSKVKAAQALWNTCNPASVVKAYTPNSVWRNRTSFLSGHSEIQAFLTQKWEKEKSYRLRKELFGFTDNKIAVQFWYEYRDAQGSWWRCYGLEDWTFGADGKMEKRMMSGNDLKINDEERWFRDDNVDDVAIPQGHW